MLPLVVGEHTEMTRFLVCDELGTDVTLGRTWLKAQKAVHDHDLDCLYIGDKMRRRVYLTNNNNAPSESVAPPEFFSSVQHGCPDEYAPRLEKLLREYADVFFRVGPLRQTTYVKHDIELTSDVPFRLPPYRYSAEKKKAIQDQVREMLADGLIEPSFSQYSSPIVMDRKKDNEYRFCNDYRRLNAITKDTAQNLPVIREVVKDVGTAKIFTTLDLKHGYWQIPLTERAKPYTAFATPDGGLYQWRVMPFGLKNAPGRFNNFITQEVLSGYMNEFVRSYLDDFVIYSSTWEEHFAHLSKVFERLRVYQLTCSIKKCFFGKQELEFLGHIITSEGNEAKPEHVHAIVNSPPPRNRKELRQFLGTCEWLREFIPKFSIIALPLTALLSSTRAWRWTDDSQSAFDELKKIFRKPLKLCRPDPDKHFILQTDACATGMGAVLYQLDDTNKRRIISHASAKFTQTEKRYHSNEQECLAVIWALRKFRHYLEDGNFTLRTDNRALTWLDNIKDGKGKLHRWAMYLRAFNFTVEHVAGKENELPDALSRNPGNEIFKDDAGALEALLPPEQTKYEQRVYLASALVQDLHERIAQEQEKELFDIKDAERFLQPTQTLQFSDGVYYVHEHGNPPRAYVPYTCRSEVIAYFHDDPLACHPGADETLRAVREHYYWPRMRDDIRRAVANCATCLITKASLPIAKGVEKARQPTALWDTVAIDMMGPYPRTSRGKRFILVATDLMSRWVEAFAVSSSEVNVIAPILEREVFMRWGYPRVVLSDNAPQFRGTSWQTRCKSWGVLAYTTPAYHPQANPTERRNQEIKKGLRLQIAGGRQRDWDLYLPPILFSMRRRINRTTGQSPSQMLLGRNLPRPGEWSFNFDEATQGRVDDARQRQAALTALPTTKGDGSLRVGDFVLAKNFALSNAAEGFNAQLAPKWTGPYTVLEKCSGDVFILERPGRENIKLHVSTLKRVPQPPHAEAVDAAQQPDDLPRAVAPPLQTFTLPEESHLQGVSSAPQTAPASRTASVSRPTRAQSAPVNEQAASADALNRASLERGAALSSAHDDPGTGMNLPTERDQPVTPYPVPNFPDFAAVAPPRRRRGRPSKRERARRADELTRPVSHHRYNLRSKNFRTDNYSE